MKTIVLLHGAWHGPWCWKKIYPPLVSNGYTVITPDIPWVYNHRITNQKVDLNSIASKISDLVNHIDGRVILAGHSMGGLLVSLISALIPDKISSAVYICGFITESGKTINDLDVIMKDSVIASNMLLDENKRSIVIPDEYIKSGLCHDCNEVDYEFAKTRIKPQLASTFLTKVDIKGTALSNINKKYIECLEDRTVPITAQRIMQKYMRFEEIISLRCGHSPFLSHPEKLSMALSTP